MGETTTVRFFDPKATIEFKYFDELTAEDKIRPVLQHGAWKTVEATVIVSKEKMIQGKMMEIIVHPIPVQMF